MCKDSVMLVHIDFGASIIITVVIFIPKSVCCQKADIILAVVNLAVHHFGMLGDIKVITFNCHLSQIGNIENLTN